MFLLNFQPFKSEAAYYYYYLVLVRVIYLLFSFVACDTFRRHKLPKLILNLHKQLYFGIVTV